MDVRRFIKGYWRKIVSPPPAISQPKCGTRPDKVSMKVYSGGYALQARGRGGVDWIFLVESTGDTIRYIVGVINHEVVVTTCARAAAALLPDIFGEGSRRLHGTVPEGGPIPPWSDHTNSCHPI